MEPIYLDNAATTRVLPEVVDAMSRAMDRDFGNPSSRHSVGLAAERQLRAAREVVGRRVEAAPEQVLFTSGGTEANGLALLGGCSRGARAHVLVSAIEHPSVLGCITLLERHGVLVDRIPVTADGWVDPEAAAALAREETRLLALMHVNNETGIEQPTAEVARAVRARAPDCWVLVDAVQSLPVLPVSLDRLGADMLTLSAHKVHGPKGVGCLVLRRGVRIAPIWGGGDQERGLRPGTENMPGIVGFSRAVELMRPDPDRMARWTQRIESTVVANRPNAYPVGDSDRRAPHLVTMAIPGTPSEVLVNMLESLGVCVSSGSACHSRRSLQQSHVAAAMGLPRDHGMVRFSLSGSTTEEEIERAVDILVTALQRI